MNKKNELLQLVKKNPDFVFLPDGKIKCRLTGHELLPKMEEFKAYVQGKKYKRAKDEDYDFKQLEPYIIPHKRDENKLFCTLTKQVLNKKKRPVLDHVNGKRYKKLLQEYLAYQDQQENEENLIEEPEFIPENQEDVEVDEDLQEEEEERSEQEKPKRNLKQKNSNGIKKHIKKNHQKPQKKRQ